MVINRSQAWLGRTIRQNTGVHVKNIHVVCHTFYFAVSRQQHALVNHEPRIKHKPTWSQAQMMHFNFHF